MITEQDLLEAIAECRGIKNPSSSTCIKLASYYTILDRMRNEEVKPIPAAYSFAAPSQPHNSDFTDMVDKLDPHEVMEVMDELMTTLQTVMPRLYNGVMRKLERLEEG